MSDRLLNLRNDKNVNQKEVADYLQLTRQAYSRYERGEREPDISTLIKLADYFNVSIDYLVGRTENNEKAVNNTENSILGAMTDEEIELVQSYRLLDDSQKISIKGVMLEFSKSWKKANTIG